jgi:hypothetical protein
VLAALAVTGTAVSAAPAATSSAVVPHLPIDRKAAAVVNRPADSLIRTINWSGRTWWVYSSAQRGPEDVKLTNDPQSVYVDGKGRLHLKIRKINGVWRSVELRSLSTVGYGTYRLVNLTRTAKFSDRTVFGMFIYRPGATKGRGANEIDVENSRFPRYLKAPNNAQFAVQPYNKPHHAYPYHVKPRHVPLTQQFTWYPPVKQKGTVKFVTRVGTTKRSPVLARWTYHGASSPTATNMYLFLTLWLNHGKPPVGGTHSAVLKSLTFRPLP